MTENKLPIRGIISFAAYILLYPIVLFSNAGTTRWGMAWAYLGISTLTTIGSRLLVHRKNPDLLRERGSAQSAKDVKAWDRKLVPIAAIYGPLAAMILAGVDFRYSWTDAIPLWGQVLALGVGTLGFIFSTWAMLENRFFSSMVRIQTERGHTVCKTGPYKIVRHPGYAGGLLWYLVTPLVLNSLWAYIPTLVALIASVIRTALEDKTLRAELPGYEEFTRETRYRLIPGIW